MQHKHDQLTENDAQEMKMDKPAEKEAGSNDLLSEAVHKCHILVVEDSASSRENIENILTTAGYNNLEFACDGVEAIEKVSRNKPDLMILDIVMPRLDGFKVCNWIRSKPNLQSLPILVQTALNEPEQRVSVFTVGATDMVSKPINAAELLARVKIQLENMLLLSDLRSFHERVESELTMARDMQSAILPSLEFTERIEQKYDIKISSHFEPSSELGGDFWGITDLGAGKVAVFIVDFSGHGVTAALNTFRLHTLIQGHLQNLQDPAAYLASLNAKVCPLLATQQYATMLYGVIDTDRDLFTYATAASPSPLFGNDQSKSITSGDGTGFFLGSFPKSEYENREVPFPKGSFLMIHSDALVEAPCEDKPYGIEEAGLISMMEKQLEKGNHTTLLRDTLVDFYGTASFPLPDDLTALFAYRKP